MNFKMSSPFFSLYFRNDWFHGVETRRADELILCPNRVVVCVSFLFHQMLLIAIPLNLHIADLQQSLYQFQTRIMFSVQFESQRLKFDSQRLVLETLKRRNKVIASEK